MSIAEVIITITGPDLVEEQGCGVCVQDLTNNLDELQGVINNSTILLGSVNGTQERLLQQEIMDSQV